LFIRISFIWVFNGFRKFCIRLSVRLRGTTRLSLTDILNSVVEFS